MNDQKGYAGTVFINESNDGYVASGYHPFASAYITYDLRTHAVELYALLKDSGLDLTKTTAKFFMISEVGRFYLFADGKSEFVTPIGSQLDFSPYESGEGFPDASAAFRLISGEDFIKAMAQSAKDYAAAAVQFDGDPQMGGYEIPEAPAPSGNILLYIAIGCFAVAAASVAVYIVIRKKRVSNKV